MFRPFEGADVYTPDNIPRRRLLIVTHEHWDHLDYNTVKRLKNRVGKVVCPLGVGEHFEYFGIPAGHCRNGLILTYAVCGRPNAIHCLPAGTIRAGYLKKGSDAVGLVRDGLPRSGLLGRRLHTPISGMAKILSIDLAVMEHAGCRPGLALHHLMPDRLSGRSTILSFEPYLRLHNSKVMRCANTVARAAGQLRKASATARPVPTSTPRIGEKSESSRYGRHERQMVVRTERRASGFQAGPGLSKRPGPTLLHLQGMPAMPNGRFP